MTGHPSQILLAALLLFFGVYVLRMRTVLLDRLIFLVCAVVGLVLVIDPELSSDIAHLLGIGRGADLVFYVFILASLFFAAGVTSELKRIRRQLTDVVRERAVSDPVEGPVAPEGNSAPPAKTDR